MFSVALVGGLRSDARRAAVDRLLALVPGGVALHHDLATAPEAGARRPYRPRRHRPALGR